MKILPRILVKDKGDTMVEVLIAIAVASSVLGIVFATSSRNLRATQNIQERSEATRLIQGQIEALRYTYLTKKASLPALSSPFCMQADKPISSPFTAGYDTSIDLTGYPLECVKGYYHYSILEETDGKYKLTVRWQNLTPTGQAQVVMVYRVK